MILLNVIPVASENRMDQENKDLLKSVGIFFMANLYFTTGVVVGDIAEYSEGRTSVSMHLKFDKEVDGVQVYIFALRYESDGEPPIVVPTFLLSSNLLDRTFLRYLSKGENLLLPVIPFAEGAGKTMEPVGGNPTTFEFKIAEEIREAAQNIENCKEEVILYAGEQEEEFLQDNGYGQVEDLFYFINKEELEKAKKSQSPD